MTRTINRVPMLPTLFTGLLLASGMTPAFAQTATTSSAAAAAKLDGSLTKSHDAWRSTKLDGATVYNDQGASIGTIDDMLLDSQGKVSNVVVSVGGFLGVGSKYVEVSFSKLRFEPSHNSAGNTATTNGNSHQFSVVLPGVSKEALTSMLAFNY